MRNFNFDKLKDNKIVDAIYCLILCAMPFMHVNYGLDYTDTGYSIMLFKDVTASHKGGYQALSTFLSNFLGALFLHMPGGNSYLGIKLYCSAFLAVFALFMFFFLKRYFHRFAVFISLAIALMLKWCPVVVLYNTLTYLFMYLSIFLIMKGLIRKKDGYLFTAGIVLGMSVFVRLPNVTEAIYILPVIYYLYLQREKIKSILMIIFKCIAGYICGALLCFIAVCLYQSPEAYIKMIKGLINVSDTEADYSKLTMLTSTLTDMQYYQKWIIISLLLILVAIIADAVYKKFFKESKKQLAINIVLCIAFLGATLLVLRQMHYWGMFITSDYSSHISVFIFVALIYLIACLVTLWIIIFGGSKSFKDTERTLAFFALVSIFIIPLGTNTGLLSFMNNMYFALPVTIGLICKRMKRELSAAKIVLGVFALATAFQSFMFYCNHIYGDVGAYDGIELKIEDDSPLNGELVLTGMGPIVESMIDYAKANEFAGRECVSYGNIPIMPFLLKMESATSNPWPDIRSYLSEDFKSALNKADRPVVILNKWYSGGDVFNEEVWDIVPKAKILADYMNINNYSLVYENDKFAVYDTEEK